MTIQQWISTFENGPVPKQAKNNIRHTINIARLNPIQIVIPNLWFLFIKQRTKGEQIQSPLIIISPSFIYVIIDWEVPTSETIKTSHSDDPPTGSSHPKILK